MTLENKIWRSIVHKGNFSTVACPYGIVVKFFDQKFVIHRRKDGKYPKIGLFVYREGKDLYRARLQISCFETQYVYISCNMVVTWSGDAHNGYRAESEVSVGNTYYVNSNWDRDTFDNFMGKYNEWRAK